MAGDIAPADLAEDTDLAVGEGIGPAAEDIAPGAVGPVEVDIVLAADVVVDTAATEDTAAVEDLALEPGQALLRSLKSTELQQKST